MKETFFALVIFIALTAYSAAGETLHGKLYRTGYYWMMKGDYERAINYFTKTIKINPKLSQAYLMRGKSYLALAQCKEAREDFYAVLDLMEEVKFSPRRVFFSNSNTDIVNSIKDEHFDVVIETAY